MLNYIDVDKIGRIFKSYNLSKDNVLDFFIEEDGDDLKYLLKLYILSALEEYKHFDKLVNSVYHETSFSEIPPQEIINRKSPKTFWKKLKSKENEKEKSKKIAWIRKYFFGYVIYLERKKSLAIDKEAFLIKLKEEKNPYQKIKLGYQELQNYLEIQKLGKKIEEVYVKYFGSLDGFDEIQKLALFAKQYVINFEKRKAQEEKKILSYELHPYYKSYKNGEITLTQFLQEYKRIENEFEFDLNTLIENIYLYSYESIIVDFAIQYFDETNIIDFLKVDILFNYHMLTKLFDTPFLQEDSLEQILFNIRIEMSKYDPTSQDKTEDRGNDYKGLKFGTNPLRPEYRETNLSERNQFFKNTARVSEIKEKMQELFSDYERIKLIDDDNEYALECYKLSQKFIQIHPYENGNGRTSKYLLDYLLLKRNILPFTITDSYYLTHCYLSSNSSQENYYNQRQLVMGRRINL